MDETQLAVQKAIEWERAKGQLRAVSAVAGHGRLTALRVEDERRMTDRWQRLDQRIEAFITDIENDGLNE